MPQTSKSHKLINKLLENSPLNNPIQNQKTVEHINAVKCVYNDIINGEPKSVIAEKLKNDLYGIGRKYISQTGINKIYSEARKCLILDFDEERPYLKEQLYTYLKDIYADCKRTGDHYNGINAINSIAKLLGLQEGAKQPTLQVNTKDGVTIKFGFNDNENEQITESEVINQDE